MLASWGEIAVVLGAGALLYGPKEHLQQTPRLREWLLRRRKLWVFLQKNPWIEDTLQVGWCCNRRRALPHCRAATLLRCCAAAPLHCAAALLHFVP